MLRLTLITLLASLLGGAGAGVLSSVLTTNALDNYANSLLGDQGFTALEPRKLNTSPLDYDRAIERVRDAQGRSLAVITSKAKDTSMPERWIGPGNTLAVGLVVSANGWILTTAEQLAVFTNPVATAEVWVRGTRYAINAISSDPLTPYVLIKLTAATGLTPIGFGDSADVQSGEQVFVLPDGVSLVPVTVAESEFSLLVTPAPAETYVTAWQVTTASVTPGPILSTTGDMLAFMTANGEAVPLHHGLAFVQETIRSGAVAHAALGAYLIDVSRLYNLDPSLRQGLSAGALVFAPTGRLAVPAKTPAAEAGVQAHDLITAIDGLAVTATTQVAEILAGYDPGQTARLNILRGGALIEVDVVLGDLADLAY